MSFGEQGGNTTLNDDLLNLNQLTGATFLGFGSGNTIYGDVANIPSNITTLNIFGSNTISGNTNNVPTTLNQLQITGLNTISGDIADLPPLNATILEGLNTVTGDIANIPNMNAANYTIRSNNSTIFGNLSDMVGFSINFFVLEGTSMMISGDTTSIPTNGTSFNVTFDSLTGDFNNITKTSAFPSLFIKGNSSITYSGGNWPINIRTLELTTNQFLQLPQFDVDQFLIDLDNDATWSSSKRLIIYGNRTSASNAAVASLILKGVTVTVYGP
jgi:adhesin/invasin